MLKYRSLIFPLAVNCRSWRLFRSNCDGSSLTVTQRLIFSSFHLHWINTLHRRTFKLEGVFPFLFKWRQTWNRQMETETQSWFFCDFVSWIQTLKKENDFEEISGIKLPDWHSDTFWLYLQILKSCQIPLFKSLTIEQRPWSLSDRLFPDKLRPLQQWGCDLQNHLHPPQQKLFFMASLPAGAQAATATITAAPTALVVQGDSLPLPPLLRLRPPTMPWPSPTPTYISSGCRHGQGRKPVSCCL